MLMMDALDTPLILTKLRVPAARPRNIPRVHLLNQLTTETETGLVLICAPAGYGKTTLLAELAHSLQQIGIGVAWYSLDKGDDSPASFGSYLVTSLIQAIGSTAELTRIAQLLRASPEIDLHKILPALINAVDASDRACWLILDDYHLISAPAIHTAIAFLIEHRPETLHIVLGSRSDPPLPLGRLRAHGQLLEVRAAQLRFTLDETTRFLSEVMKLDLSLEMIAAVEARTEGWAAGLQLVAIVLQSKSAVGSSFAAQSPLSLTGRADSESLLSSFAGSHRYLFQYLLEDVFNRQSEEVQWFLLLTSILERMCRDICDAVLKEERRRMKGEAGEPSSIIHPASFILDDLEQSNLFVVALDDQGDWYRYHHLFRDFLRTRLLKSRPELVPALHRAASEWFAAHGSLREAAQHAFQTQDWDYAAAFVEQHSSTMIIHSELSTIYEWCSGFPEEVMRAHPMLCILQCWPWVFRFRRQDRDRIEARLQLAEQAITALEDRQLARELTEHAAVVRSFLAMAPDPAADPREPLALAQRALGSYPEGDAGQFSLLLTNGYAHMALHDAQAAAKALEAARQVALSGRLYSGIVESTFHLARLAHSQGELRRAEEICREGQRDIAVLLAHPEQELPPLGCLDIALGCVLLEQDQLEEAERRLLKGLDLIGWGMNPYHPMTACVALFRLREIQGRSVDALDTLSRLEAAWPDIAFFTQGLRIMNALREAAGDPREDSDTLAKATAWCQTFSPPLVDDAAPPGMGPFGAAEVYYLAYLAWVRAQIAMGKARPALSYLERQLTLAETHGLRTRVIELSLLEAQAAHVEGDDQRTWAALERALVSAQPDGFIRIFDQGSNLSRLLAEAARRGICREYVGQILSILSLPKTLDKGRKDEAVLPSAAARSSIAPDLGFGEHLSERELEVLRLMAQGASNQAIAEQLVITVGTVKSHINHILGKLDAHNRTEAVARARGLGLLDL